MPNELTRRHFLGGAVVATAGCQTGTQAPSETDSSTSSIPTRPLGRTGASPSILALGCGSRLGMYGEEEKGVEAVTLALDLGITYLDTAQAYGGGNSETWVGKAMRHRRDEVFLATKVAVRGYDEALRETERSLERLQTDRIDLLHIHSLRGEEDLAAVEAGSLRAIMGLRDQGVCRFVGITSHTYPDVLAKALERHDFDCTQMALNAAQQGRIEDPGQHAATLPEDSFESVALPVALRKNLGVLAMKVTGQGHLVGDGAGKSGVQRLLRYALSLPVTSAVVGMPTLEFLRQNVQIAQVFQPMAPGTMREFSKEMAGVNKQVMDVHFCYHEDV